MTDRPLRADARRNRERVLAAAQAAFADEGLSVPLDEIARRAGVGAGTVYRHFPTKEALFEAAILDRTERLIARARNLATAADPGQAFFGLLSHMLEESTVKKDLIDTLGGSHHETALAGLAQQVKDAVGALLVRAQESGAIRADIGLPELMALLRGCFFAIHDEGLADSMRDRVFSVVFDGLRARQGSPVPR